MKKNEKRDSGGMTDFALQLVDRFRRGEILSRASSLSYDVLMAAIPLLLLFLLLSSFFFAQPTGPLSQILALLPEGIATVIQNVVLVLNNNLNAGTIGVGLISALWLGSNGINKLITDVNRSFGLRLRGNSLLRRAFAIAYTVLFAVTILLTLLAFVFSQGLIQLVERVIDSFDIRQLTFLLNLLDSFILRLLPLILLVVVLVLFYKSVPLVSHGHITWRQAFAGGLAAGIGILFLTVVYGYILDNVSKLSLYFGSLAGILGLFVYLKYTSLIILVAAEVIAILRNSAPTAGAGENGRRERHQRAE